MHWVFTAALGLSLAAVSGAALAYVGFSSCRAQALDVSGLVVPAHRLSCSEAVAQRHVDLGIRSVPSALAGRFLSNVPLFLILTGGAQVFLQAQKPDCGCFWLPPWEGGVTMKLN